MLPKFISRMLKRGGYGSHFEQRIGHFGAGTQQRIRAHPRIWIHAVSVGEIYVAFTFIRAYRKVHPDSYFVLSTTTSTAHAIAQKEIDPEDVLFYFPVDLPLVIRKVLRIIQPKRIILVEGELWPNLIRLADQQGIPVSLINGRMSESSFTGYRRIRSFTADILKRINPIIMQSGEDAARVIELGADPKHVHEVGTVKFDIGNRDPIGEAHARQVLEQLGAESAVVVLGGSTWSGEEEVLCRIFSSYKGDADRFLVLVPRHAERADEVEEMLKGTGLTYIRKSQIIEGAVEVSPDVLLIDTTGELRHFYAAADLIFVGKSLCEHGGQNPIEPAMCGKAILVGPNMENFPAVVPLFLQHQAMCRVADKAELTDAIHRLIDDPVERERLGAAAEQVVISHRGVIEKTVKLLRQG